MFCSSCGTQVAPDKSFCTNCGAPAPKADDAPAAEQPAEQVTAPLAARVATPVAAPVAAQPPAQAATQPATPTRPPKRNGVVIGAVAAIIIVLAGAGVGLWLGLRGDDGGAAGSATTVATIPGLDGTAGSTGDTAPAGDALTEYRIAVENVLMELDFDNGRIPELADIINAHTPDVPQGVHDDLQAMLGRTQTATDALLAQTPPPALGQANSYLMDAAAHMLARIQATMDGIQAGWDADSTSAALPYYTTGRAERDAYLASMQQFHALVPVGTLPGD